MTNPLIIDKPELQSPQKKIFFSMLTFIFWVIWFYIWLPLVSLIAWLLGIDFFYEHMIILGGIDGLISEISWYGTIITLSALTLVAWSVYNMMRFRNKNRRSSLKQISLEDQSDYFKLETEALKTCQQEKRVVISVDEEDRLIITAGPQSDNQPLASNTD